MLAIGGAWTGGRGVEPLALMPVRATGPSTVTPKQARIAEEAGAYAVMALERFPADIRVQGGVARMSDPGLIRDIKRAVTIPVMAKARIDHFVEAQILEAVGVDYADWSEVLTPPTTCTTSTSTTSTSRSSAAAFFSVSNSRRC